MAKKSFDHIDGKVTPLMAQYYKLKAKHPDAILLYRVGDFYETFGEDAIKVSEIVGIVLTKRNNGGLDIELAGFPYHSLDLYLPRLVRAGFRVAICEQLEKPSKEKKIVDRGITDVVTPGIAIEDSLLERKSNNYLASIFYHAKGVAAAAFLDISTGEFLLSEGSPEMILKTIGNFQPSEIIYGRSINADFLEQLSDKYYTYALDDWIFSYDYAREKLLDKFSVPNLKGYGVEEFELGQIAAGAIIHYIQSTQNRKLDHINSIHRIQSDDFMWLDRFTIRNLELVDTLHDGGSSLLDILDSTSSALGARLMKKWTLMPLIHAAKIDARLDGVSYLLEHADVALSIDTYIKQIGDLERIISKCSMSKVNAREVLQLKTALNACAPIKEFLAHATYNHLNILGDLINECEFIRNLIEQSINENAPALLIKGDTIKDGHHAELDDIRNVIRNSKKLLLEIQLKEVERTGISSLKIGFNNVFGYYLEVTNRYKDNTNIPSDWVRKQTLANAERYITDDLKKLEDKILHAEEIIQRLEDELFTGLVNTINEYIQPIQQNAKVIAEIDCLLAFAKNANKYKYCKPVINESLDISIKDGRHAVIEHLLRADQSYVPNDTLLSNNDTQIMMITGPNMSGKSALLRQCALITLMAQIGSYVPAKAASIGIVDKIFTRVGASDNISSGESTFMLEMNETASIMNNISERSLILLDEIGRGTSTYDGISIAWSLAEFLHNNPIANPKTLFATHYHELNDLSNSYPRIKNFNVATREVGNKVVFLRKLMEGGCEHSFGIHVAAMAGMPKTIVERAMEILEELELKSTIRNKDGQIVSHVKEKNNSVSPKSFQLSIFETFDPQAGKLKEEIQKIELNTMSPIDCMIKLHELQKLLKEENPL